MTTISTKGMSVIQSVLIFLEFEFLKDTTQLISLDRLFNTYNSMSL